MVGLVSQLVCEMKTRLTVVRLQICMVWKLYLICIWFGIPAG